MAPSTPVNRYRVILNSSGARLPEKVRLDLNFQEPNSADTRAMIENRLEKGPEDVLVPVGLRYMVEVSAIALDEALSKAIALSDGITSFISLSERLGLPPPLQEIAYDISPGINERAFLQLFHNLPVDLPRKAIDPEFLMFSLRKVIEEKDERRRDRISRGVRWYRKGALSIDVFDKFISYWTGLEALNPLLQNEVNSADQAEDTIQTVSGIKAFMQKFYPGDLYKRAHELRVELIHSTKPLVALTSEASSLEVVMGEVLRRSIYFLLGSEIQQGDEVEARSATAPAVTMGFEGIIHGTQPNELGPPGEQPHLEVTRHEVISTKVEDPKIERTVTSTFTARTREGVSITLFGWRLYGPKGATGELHAVKVTPEGDKQPRQESR
jgi:hypothetical protein